MSSRSSALYKPYVYCWHANCPDVNLCLGAYTCAQHQCLHPITRFLPVVSCSSDFFILRGKPRELWVRVRSIYATAQGQAIAYVRMLTCGHSAVLNVYVLSTVSRTLRHKTERVRAASGPGTARAAEEAAPEGSADSEPGVITGVVLLARPTYK
jgi:hypothetical protein